MAASRSSTMDNRSTINIRGIVTDEADTPKGLSTPVEVTLAEFKTFLSASASVTVANVSDASALGRTVMKVADSAALRVASGVSVYDNATAQNAIKIKAAIAALTSSSTAADIVAALKA